MTLYQNEIGEAIQLNTYNNLDTATVVEIHVLKPSGTTVIWPGTVVNHAVIQYITVDGDLDELGDYSFQAYVEWGATSKHFGNTVIMTVYPIFSPDIIITPLSELVMRVRSAVSDIPENMLSDSQVYDNIKKADQYIRKIVPDSVYNVNVDYTQSCIVNLASYYTYLSYTALAEVNLGNLPPTSLIRLNALKEIALSFLLPITPYRLNPDLSINENALAITKGIGFGKGPTILDMD